MCQPTRPGYRPTQTADQAQPVTSHGFTLLEIMVALTIVAIVFTALFAVFDRVTDVAGTVDRRARLSQEARLVVLQIRRDLTSIVLPETAPETEPGNTQNVSNASSGIIPISGQTPADEFLSDTSPVLSFTTRAGLSLNATFPRHEMNVVSYTIQPDNDHDKQYTLVRSERPLVKSVDHDRPVGGQTVLMSSRIASFQVLFFDEQSGRTVSSWGKDMYAEENEQKASPVWVAIQVKFSGPHDDKAFRLLSMLRPPKEPITRVPELDFPP